MYVPKLYTETDDAVIDAHIRANGFATLVTAAQGEPFATHVPLELVRGEHGERIIEGHVSRANPHWKLLESGASVLAIFAGPHSYVSSSWYAQENVPTWNYLVVHAYGTARIESDPTRLRELLVRLSRHYEPLGAPEPRFDVDRLTPGFYGKEVRGIVGFTIPVSRIEVAFKLSQNRNAADHANVIHKLKERGDEQSAAVAAAMERRTAPSA
jgi:transcriptional regulator